MVFKILLSLSKSIVSYLSEISFASKSRNTNIVTLYIAGNFAVWLFSYLKPVLFAGIAKGFEIRHTKTKD